VNLTMMGPLQWQEERVGGVVVIALERSLKGGVEAALKERIDELVRQGDLQIVIDLEWVPYVDSTELGRLMRCHLSVRKAGGRVRLCNLSERMRLLLRMTHLDTVFDLHDSREAALSAVGAGHSLSGGGAGAAS
jgi:anti-sigma B factor antagonist